MGRTWRVSTVFHGIAGVGVPVCHTGFTRRKALRLPGPVQPAGRGGMGKDQSVDMNFPSAKAGKSQMKQSKGWGGH